VKRLLLTVLFIVSFGFPAKAANPTFVGSATPVTSTNGTDTSITITYSPSSGNCVLIALGSNVSTLSISSVKDSSNNVIPLLVLDTNGSKFSAIYGTTGVASGITSFTVTFTAGPHIWGTVAEYSGVSNFGQITDGDTAGTVTSASLSITTQANNNIFVGMFTIYGSATGITGTGSTNVRQTSSFSDVGAFADTALATAGSISTAISWTVASPYAAVGLELSSNPMNIVQFIGANCNSATTCSATFTQAVQISNYVIPVSYDGTSSSANDTFSDGTNSYTQVMPTTGGTPHSFCGLSVDGDTVAMSYAKATTNVALTVTIANGGTSGHKIILLAEVNGLASSSPLDQTSSCINTSGVTSLTTGSVTTGFTNEIILAVFGLAASATFTPGTNYILLSQIPSGAGNGVEGNESREVTSIASYNASMTISASQEMAGFLATFKAAIQPVPTTASMTFGPTKVLGGTTKW
jgi:hypothetical protein